MAVTVKIENVTPQKAKGFLDLNTNNRAFKAREIEQMARDIQEGRWVLNGESFKLGSLNGNGHDDVLCDGQNRAAAIIKAGIAVDSVVVRGLPFEVIIATIDAGAKRTTGDMLKILRNEKNYSSLAGAISWAYRQEHHKGKDRGFTGSHAELLAFLDANPSLHEANALALHAKRTFPLVRAAPFAAALFHGMQVDDELTRLFSDQVGTGENLTSTDPAFTLRAWLTRAAGASRQPVVDAFPYVINRALIAHLEGRELGKVAYRPDRPFPYVQDAEIIEAGDE